GTPRSSRSGVRFGQLNPKSAPSLLRPVPKGRLIMNDRALASIPSPECNDFLLAVIDEAPNGTQLTVLSALAQANVDPWEEAARLSAMSKVTAEKTLVSMFERIPGRNWSPSEEATIAARLVKLLPPRGGGGTEAATM